MSQLQLDKVIGLMIKEIVLLRVETKEQRALLNVLSGQVSSDFLNALKQPDAAYEARRQELADNELQALLDRFDLESNEMTEFLKSLFH